MIAVIKSTGSNFTSVRFALRRLGVDVEVTEDAETVKAASHVILPGVGSAQTGMARLRRSGLHDVVPHLTQPVLGICLGMQLLYEGSEEGSTAGLGVFSGTVSRLNAAPEHPVPHMGWNRVEYPDKDAGWAYFVHSYAAPVGPDTVATTTYTRTFTSVVARGNFVGVQFHPERSADFGSAILRDFLESTWSFIPQ